MTIFDAEDLPEPLQLRRVVVVFDRLGDNVACVQAKLAFHNGTQNLLTGWFTADYALWFNFILPGLMKSHSPIPLGGTSNHIRRSVFDEIGAWDPYNVTEDADLGVRIAESGYSTAVLDSTTLEEANSDPINWVRQRSRWYKGYLQTWLVHMRRPVRLWRVIGTAGMLRFTTLLAGTPIIACLNMVFWMTTLAWLLGQAELIEEIFPWYAYFPALISLVFGNVAVMYMNFVACRETGHSNLWWPCLTVPFYWSSCRSRRSKAPISSSVILPTGRRPSTGCRREDPQHVGVLDRLPDLSGGRTVARAGRAVLQGDSLSRVSAARSVLLSRDPHLAAIGFVFTPLTALVQVPLTGLSAWFPGLSAYAVTAVLMSAPFMAGAAVQIHRVACDRGCTRGSCGR